LYKLAKKMLSTVVPMIKAAMPEMAVKNFNCFIKQNGTEMIKATRWRRKCLPQSGVKPRVQEEWFKNWTAKITFATPAEKTSRLFMDLISELQKLPSVFVARSSILKSLKIWIFLWIFTLIRRSLCHLLF
jgi:hypothetical protein